MRRWTCLTVAGQAVVFVLLGTMVSAAPAKKKVAANRGVRIAATPAVTQTVEQIMARQQATPQRLTPRLHPEHEVDRRGLRHNPRSPKRGTWPPLPDEATRLRETPPYAPQSLGTNFDGATLADTNAFPPDTMGAAGPTQFIVFLNGRLRSFNKATGAADGVLNADPDAFFAPVMTPGSNFTSDPRIRYDRLSGRWFMTIIDVPAPAGQTPNRILLAVSDAASSNAVTGATVWTLRSFQGDSTNFADYDTLGIDNNALYIGANMFSTSTGKIQNTNGYVIQKSSVVTGGPAVVTKFANLLDPSSTPDAFQGPLTPQGVDNFDTGATQGYFIGVSAIHFDELVLRRISNPGTVSPTISGNIVLAVPTTSLPINVPHFGGSPPLDALDDRLFAAQIRNGRLWTAHNIEVDSSGAGVITEGSGGRNGSRWYELQNLSTTPSLVQAGTVFDSSGSNPLSYWIPSVNISGQGHVAMGVSVAGAASRVDAATMGRLSGDTLGTMRTPVRYTNTSASYNQSNNRWGDYSYTSVDPSDDMTMWTIQEYVDFTASNSYAVRVVRLVAPPPATPNCTAPAQVTGPNQNATIIGTQVNGSGFFDPGPGFTNRIQASVSGGVTVNSVTYNSPTSVTLNVTPTPGAGGFKNVTITNPDGQAITGNNCIEVPSADLSIAKSDGQTTAVPGTTVTYTITASNAGPSKANGTVVTDTPPGILTGVTWTCTPSGGATCTAPSGAGSINQAVNLPAGTSVTFTLTGTVNPSATGTLTNTATITNPTVPDPNGANNSATDTDTLTPQADLAITKNDGHGAAQPGQAITYTIFVSNPGPSSLPGATVMDVPPAALVTPTWTCTGAGGGTCTASGAGTINDAANLPAGGSVTYLLSGTINAAATGNVSNTATVTPPGGATDPDSSNNSATDVDPLLINTPDNDTPFAAKDLQIGGVSTDTLGAPPNAQNWFRYTVRAGRSYCVEVDNGRGEISIRDTVLSLFRADTVTSLGTNDNITDEPGGPLLSRVCYIAPASEDNVANVTAGASNTTGTFRVRVVDTTVFCPWFFSGNGFEAFILIKNTTGTTRNVTARLSSASGTTLGTQSGTALANGSYNLQVSAAPPTGFGLSSASGGVYIAHNGPPGSLVVNVTSLSFVLGVSFDTPASPRQDNH